MHRMLKKNLWQHVEPLKAKPSSTESDQPEESAQGEKETESEAGGGSPPTTEATMSFKDTMLAVKNTVPDNVSVSYFFICMLHLANEKVRFGTYWMVSSSCVTCVCACACVSLHPNVTMSLLIGHW